MATSRACRRGVRSLLYAASCSSSTMTMPTSGSGDRTASRVPTTMSTSPAADPPPLVGALAVAEARMDDRHPGVEVGPEPVDQRERQRDLRHEDQRSPTGRRASSRSPRCRPRSCRRRSRPRAAAASGRRRRPPRGSWPAPRPAPAAGPWPAGDRRAARPGDRRAGGAAARGSRHRAGRAGRARPRADDPCRPARSAPATPAAASAAGHLGQRGHLPRARAAGPAVDRRRPARAATRARPRSARIQRS